MLMFVSDAIWLVRTTSRFRDSLDLEDVKKTWAILDLYGRRFIYYIPNLFSTSRWAFVTMLPYYVDVLHLT